MLNRKKLVWRCRRGVRELDVLLSRFLDSEYDNLDQKQQAAFQRLLDIQDPVIMDWLFGKSTSDDQGVDRIIKKLQATSGIFS